LELNWSTFVLEIINFLVLVWILQRFFYKPVLEVIARRRAAIDKTVADAKALQADAEALQSQYRQRLAAWEQERQQAREQLAGEIEAERAQRLATLQSQLDQEREKAQVAERRRQTDAEHKAEETALTQAAGFASRLLAQLAGPDLEQRLLELLLEQLARLPDERRAALRNSCGRAPETILVSSAWPLSENQRQQLSQALTATMAADLPLRFEQNSALLAGLRITIGAWVLGANLQDELKALAEFAHDAQHP
jgi:F-type H+-transporting ATPase subunit b